MGRDDNEVDSFPLGVVLVADGVIFKASGKLQESLSPLRELYSEDDAEALLKNCKVKVVGKLGN